LNRKDCCGDRLASTKVEVDGQLCGTLPSKTENGKWYTVKCQIPGKKIKVSNVKKAALQIADIIVVGHEEAGARST
jgi:hypothetical protein